MLSNPIRLTEQDLKILRQHGTDNPSVLVEISALEDRELVSNIYHGAIPSVLLDCICKILSMLRSYGRVYHHPMNTRRRLSLDCNCSIKGPFHSIVASLNTHTEVRVCNNCYRFIRDTLHNNFELFEDYGEIPYSLSYRPSKLLCYQQRVCYRCGWSGYENEMPLSTSISKGPHPCFCPGCHNELVTPDTFLPKFVLLPAPVLEL